MLMELCVGIPEQRGESLLSAIHKQLILGLNSDGKPFGVGKSGSN